MLKARWATRSQDVRNAALLLSLAFIVPGERNLFAGEAQELRLSAGKFGTFPAYIPSGASKEHPFPVIVACHGRGDTADDFLEGLKPWASSEGLAVLSVDNTPDQGVSIVEALRTLLKEHSETDAKRIVWLGFSAGTGVACRVGAPQYEAGLCHGVLLCAPGTAAPEPPARERDRKARPRVCLFLGTVDPSYPALERFRARLRDWQGAYTLNEVTGLEHTLPPMPYLTGALHWLLESDAASEDNILPKDPPDLAARACHHLLVRHKGALGAGSAVKRPAEAARKEAERIAGLLRKEKPGKRAARAGQQSLEGGALTEEAAGPFGPLLRWACWTLPPGSVRVARSPAGWHVVWGDGE